MVVVVTKSLFWTLWTLLRPRVWGGDRDMEARGPNEGTSGVRGGGKHSNTILDHWSSFADCIRVSLILPILQCKDISAAQMEFTQIWWVHNTMCTRIWCALSQWFLWSRGCRYIKTPHVAPWTDHLSNKMQSQTTGTGAGKKHFAYICTLEQLSEMSSVLFSIFLEGLDEFLKYWKPDHCFPFSATHLLMFGRRFLFC